MPVSCPRCGGRWLSDARFCVGCANGEADPERARQILAAALDGNEDATRLLATIDDRRAVPILLEATTSPSDRIRRAAFESLAWAADSRALPAATEALSDQADLVRRAAIECLAELGSPAAADALAAHLEDPRDVGPTATALGWLRDPRALQPLLALMERPYDSGNVLRGSTQALGWLGNARAVAPLVVRLEELGDRWLAATSMDSPRPDWQAQSEALVVCMALQAIGGADALAAVAAAEARFGEGRLVFLTSADVPRFAYRAPPDPRRTVPRWSLQLERTLLPVRGPVTKFGGQPVWVADPTWPLGSDGGPMTFFAQFAVPGVDGLAYLFIDYSEESWTSPYDGSALLMQPGPIPERYLAQATGPTYASEFSELDRYVPRTRTTLVESVPTLEEGLDPADWEAFDADRPVTDIRDDNRDWNKVAGTPRYLQGGPPDPDGLRFLFQFTAMDVGHELGDGAECYGLIDEDRRGCVLIESH